MKPCIKCGHPLENQVEQCPKCAANQAAPQFIRQAVPSPQESKAEGVYLDGMAEDILFVVVIPLISASVGYYFFGGLGLWAGLVALLLPQILREWLIEM